MLLGDLHLVFHIFNFNYVYYMFSSNTVKILIFGIMADLGLYENFLEHARLEEALMYRRRNGELRNLELAFEMPDSEFVGLYRLNKCLALNLIRELEPYLPSKGGLSTLSKVLTTLSFYASGSYQRFIGASAHHKMHQVSVSNCIRAVTLVLNNEHFRKKYIYFPQNRQERNVIKHGKCPTRQVFVRAGRSHCIDSCNAATMCGEVKVPEHHLNPCYVCNSTGHNCRALPRVPPSPAEDETTEIIGNALNFGTDLPEATDEEIEPNGVEDTDFVLYVSAVETERCKRGLTVAYASHCQQESALDRPVAGHANFCPGELSTKYRDLPSVMSTVKHEMLHALGFSVSLFAFYRDDNGEPLTERRPDTGNPPLDEELQIHKWSDRVVKNVTRKNWMIRGGFVSRTFHMMVTPRVVREVRDHFNCSQLEGAELEDQGGDGTALTHWEKRVFENEAMTGTHTQNSVFSRITFAMMEDTGWYRADYSRAATLDWGRGLGCKFAMNSCKEWLNTQRFRRKNPSPFCERIKGSPLRTECSPRRNAVVLCNLVRHDTILPRVYQHFDILPGTAPGEEAHYGGSVSLADYCPYLQEFTWRHKSVLVRGSRCEYEENTPKTDVNFALENYGQHSKCFDHSDRVWEQKSCRQIREWQHWGSGCYKYKCESGRLHIVVGNYSYTCFHAGQNLQIRIIKKGWLHKGGVVCPPCRELCGAEFASRNEYCRMGEEALPSNLYQNDVLKCGVAAFTPAAILTTAAILIASLFRA